MKIFAIKDDTLSLKGPLGYLIYCESARAFYIEIDETIEPRFLPPLLSSFAAKHIRSIDRFWSRRFVQYRIVPPDRQNIGLVLRDNGLKEYDEYALLMRAEGRCEQDDCYLEEVTMEELPDYLNLRWQNRIVEVIPLKVPELLVFYAKGDAKRVNVQALAGRECQPYLADQDRFDKVAIQPGGFGIEWSERAYISYRELLVGDSVPLTVPELNRYLQHRLVNAAEAGQLLGCSRQNIDDLMRRNKLHPLRKDAKYKLFSRAEVENRMRE